MSLRQSRRQQTAADIQAAALRLVRQHGLEQVTTDAIAAEAGVSPRTFFNYYRFKEAALLGPPLGLPEEAAERFRTSTGPLLDDLIVLLRAHLARREKDREAFRLLRRLAFESPKILALHQTSILALRDKLTALIMARMPGDMVMARLLALLMIDLIRITMERWLEQDQTLDETLVQIAARLPDLGTLLHNEEAQA